MNIRAIFRIWRGNMAKKEKIIEAEVKEIKNEDEVEKAYFFPRAIAYFVDVIIVLLISSLFK